MTTDRLARYGVASTALALLSDRQLGAVVRSAPVITTGIGGSAVALEVGGVPVFAKRVALTDLEREPANVHSTANLFGMPTFSHYGLGSAGCGVWRELAAQVMTSNWVLEGRSENFPLLYHWRVLETTPAAPTPEQLTELDRQVRYWNGAPEVRERLTAIAGASASVVLFCERLPYSLYEWLTAQVAAGPEAVDAACAMVEPSLLTTVSSLNANGLLHFDTHSGNFLTDGRRLYLSDFGLATSPRFDLSSDERDFVDRHASHDAGYASASLVSVLVAALTGRTDRVERAAFVRRCVEHPEDAELAALPPRAVAVIRRYAPVATLVNDLYSRLHQQSRTTPYPAAEIHCACVAAGWPLPPAD